MSASKSNRRNALHRQEKRHRSRPQPKIISARELEATPALEDAFTDRHLDILQNIEFTIVAVDRNNEGVDDWAVLRALKVVMGADKAEDWESIILVQALRDIRSMREEVDTETWMAGLSVVLTSVRRHSRCRRGDRDYLDFIDEFIK